MEPANDGGRTILRMICEASRQRGPLPRQFPYAIIVDANSYTNVTCILNCL